MPKINAHEKRIEELENSGMNEEEKTEWINLKEWWKLKS